MEGPLTPNQSNALHPTSWVSILILSSHLSQCFPNGLIPSGIPIKTLYEPPQSHTRATCHVPCPSHPSRFSHPYNIWWGAHFIMPFVMHYALKIVTKFRYMEGTLMKWNCIHEHIKTGLNSAKARYHCLPACQALQYENDSCFVHGWNLNFHTDGERRFGIWNRWQRSVQRPAPKTINKTPYFGHAIGIFVEQSVREMPTEVVWIEKAMLDFWSV